MHNFPPEWPTREAIETLTQRLGLRKDWLQDWELEVADASRVGDFCTLYEDPALSMEERFALMALIAASFDNYLQGTPTGQRDPTLEMRIEQQLRQDFPLHYHTVEYWSCLDRDNWANPADPDDPENCFLITPLMRRVWRTYVGEQ